MEISANEKVALRLALLISILGGAKVSTSYVHEMGIFAFIGGIIILFSVIYFGILIILGAINWGMNVIQSVCKK